MSRASFEAWLIAGTAMIAAAGLWAAGCVPPAPRNSLPVESLKIVNAGRADVRVALDRSRSLGVAQPSGQAAPLITDITPQLTPGDSVTLDLSDLSAAETFEAYVLVDGDDDLRGPFACRIDLACGNADATSVIWTGSEVLCTGRIDVAVVELVNGSDASVYLLAEDEQPALPLLPLAPGESRFVQVARPAGSAGIFVQAVEVTPIFGASVVDFTSCRLAQSCRSTTVRFDGRVLDCGD